MTLGLQHSKRNRVYSAHALKTTAKTPTVDLFELDTLTGTKEANLTEKTGPPGWGLIRETDISSSPNTPRRLWFKVK